MDLDRIVEELKTERARLDRAISALEDSAPPKRGRKTRATDHRPAKRKAARRHYA